MIRDRRLPIVIASGLAFGLMAWTALALGSGGRRVELPDGRRIFLHCMGRGEPTVVFESGYRGTSGAWYKVQPAVARFTRACAYDRAGYGRSDPGPEPRDGAAVVRDLEAVLAAERVRGPYVMVGHSAGGLYVRQFASQRPRDVVGMVLVDPSVEHQDARIAAALGSGAGGTGPLRDRDAHCLEAAQAGLLPSSDPALAACAPGSGRKRTDAAWKAAAATTSKASYWRTALSELDTLWTSTSAEIDAGPSSYGAMPLIVLTAGGTYAAAPAGERETADSIWRTLHREVAARSSRGEERLVPGASHEIMLDQPDAVTTAVREVVEEARAQHR